MRKCEYCGMWFSNRKSLSIHTKKMHVEAILSNADAKTQEDEG